MWCSWPARSKSSCWSLLLQSAPSGQPGQDHAYELAGPVVDGEGRTDVVNDQKQVDDLLASLGF